MFDTVLGPVIIATMRVCDVSIGTFRTILVVQGRKWLAAVAGFFEVLIWVFAIRFVFQHLDNIPNLFGYAIGFAMGNVIGIHFEQQIGLGYVQMSIISRLYAEQIADHLRSIKYGVTILPGEGGTGGVAIIISIVSRKNQKHLIKEIEKIDKHAFITIQSALPYRGFFHGARK
jgi:uncharacterized protein YebE (UPF0316 family)